MRSIFRLVVIIFLAFGIQNLYAQCIPGDTLSCPDPENNGEICPDSLALVFVGVPYHQELTMIPPSSIDTLGYTADLYHISLESIDGLPEGITWETNTDDNIFHAGVYYCILFSGTTNANPGEYPIKIEVDLYIKFLNDTLVLPGLIDSTSISVNVKWDPDDIDENNESELISKVWPNPLSTKLYLEFAENFNESAEIEIFNMMGNLLFYQRYDAGLTVINIDLSLLPKGVFMLSVKKDGIRQNKLITKFR